MWQIALIVGLGLVGAAVAADKRKASPDSKPKEPDVKPESKAPPAPSADELRAQGRAEALAEIKAERAAQKKLELAVRRAMGNSPRARVAPPASDDGDDDPAGVH